MADLEDMGLVSAPHTSAGRVPTAKGYRLFVDTLVRYRQPRGNDLRRLQSHLQQKVDDPGALIGSVSNMLSDITSLAGVVTVPRGQQAILRQIEFLPLSDNRMLVDPGHQRSRGAEPDPAYSSGSTPNRSCRQAANFINEQYAGMEMHAGPRPDRCGPRQTARLDEPGDARHHRGCAVGDGRRQQARG